MDFDNLMEGLKERLQQPLPGVVAHEPMRATSASGLTPRFEHTVLPRPGAVLILLYGGEGGRINFPLIKRADYIGTHSGQISLPGGKAEPGENPARTALREANEEIGIDPSSVEVIGSLSDFFVIPSNFMVTPVIARVASRPLFIPDPREVVRILEADLHSLVDDAAVLKKEILVAGQWRLIAPHFEIDGEIVWGATAMILNELRMLMKELKA